MTRHITEPLAPGLTRDWTITDVIFEANTRYQHMLIGRTSHGITLFSGDIDTPHVMERQSSELSQLVYHESLMVPPLAVAESLDRVLIIGSSEGVATQIALQAGAAHVDHVDIDHECVERCATYLPYGYTEQEVKAAFAGDGPVRLHIADGLEFVEARVEENRTRPMENRTLYDVIVIDVQDENPARGAQHNRLYAPYFLRRCKELLTPSGVLSTQAGSPTLWQQDTLHLTLQRYSEVFTDTLCYTSVEHAWSFVSGSSRPTEDPLSILLQRRLAALPYRPEKMDALSAVSATILPFHARPALASATGPVQEP
jgi:spermidine synthase